MTRWSPGGRRRASKCVTVTVTQTDTGFTRTVVTESEGSYVMPNLPTGPYRLEVSLQGVRVSDTQTLELRVEAFNLFNTFNWGTPNTDISSGSFGRITSIAGDPRILQFGVKYGF